MDVYVGPRPGKFVTSIRRFSWGDIGQPWNIGEGEEEYEEIEILEEKPRPFRRPPLWFPFPNQFNMEIPTIWKGVNPFAAKPIALPSYLQGTISFMKII